MRRIVLNLVGLGAAVAVAACPRGARVGGSGPASATGEAAMDTVTGTLRQIGSTPFVRTVLVGADTVTITGQHERELERLSGAVVRVVGSDATGPLPGRYVKVISYEILDVGGGDRPLVGMLRSDAAGFYLETGASQPARLHDVSEDLQAQVGSRVWVVLSSDSVVERYGVLVESADSAEASPEDGQ